MGKRTQKQQKEVIELAKLTLNQTEIKLHTPEEVIDNQLDLKKKDLKTRLNLKTNKLQSTG